MNNNISGLTCFMSDAKLGLVQKLELSNMRPWVGDGKDHVMQTLNK